MASSVTISVKGLAELGARMEKLKAEVAVKASRSAVAAAALVVKKAAIVNAPAYFEEHLVKDALVQPGNLKRNIISKRLPRSPLTAEYIVTVRGKKKDGYAARYGRLVEYGTVKMAAQPFLRPALANNIDKAVAAMAKRLDKAIKKAGA